ncbi:MAG: hypothetical protein M3M94_05825 [Actinomycetota bacterium]|nr:hypothetical protein [Actinomycetota bacterium]
MRALVVLVAIAVVVLGGAAGASDTRADAVTAGLASHAAPPWRGDAIVHVRWDDSHEEWLDTRNDRTRKVVYGTGGERLLWVRARARIASWSEPSPPGSYLTEIVDPHDPRLDHASDLVSWWHMVSRGDAHVAGRGEINGRPVLIVERDKKPRGDAPPDLRVFADVDATTFLPLRVRIETGGKTFVRTPEYETVSPESLPPTFFVAERRDWTIRERRLRYRDLGSAPFAVYTLGETYRDLRFGTAALVEQPGAPARRVGQDFRRTVYVGYVRGRPYDDPAFELTERRITAPRVKVRGNARVRIEGKMRRAFVARDGFFWVAIGRTRVQGRADLPRAEVLRLLRALRRVD